MIGQSVGHYQITDKIGVGGMGEVYRATDTRLNRQVALKVLPQVYAQDAQRMGRFEREAQVLASLNHPNIASIYGLEEADGTKFLVMELVEGEDLSEQIARGSIPLEEALPIALQIAEALETAHGKGIIHRDLKPANIKLTSEGKVKVLDFGLAKALEDPVSKTDSDGVSRSPTLSIAATQAGVILGTAAYMSPEQARGKPVDKRTDIWSFGVVLFEMLSGKSPFQGRTVSDVLAAVLKSELEWDDLPAATPSGVRRLLRRCLSKEPENRLHHIADARLEVREALAGGSPDEFAGGVPPTPTSLTPVLPWIVAVLGIVLAGLSAWIYIPFSTSEPRPTLSLAVPFPRGTHLFSDQVGNLAISPTGSHIAVVLYQGDVKKIFLRALDDPRMFPLDGTEHAEGPFFSPDGRWLGFIADDKLRKISVDGGTPLTICGGVATHRGASWGSGDVIVFSPANDTPLMMVPGSGGAPTPITTLDVAAKERTHRWPQVLPRGDVVLFTVGYLDRSENYEESPIDAVRIATGERKRILEGASFARYLESGHLIFARGGFLFAVPFDSDSLEVRGTPVPVMEGVMGNRNSGLAYMDVSAGGLLAFIPGDQAALHSVPTWANADGTLSPLAAPADGYTDPRLSPDGRRIAFTLLGDLSMDVWIYNIVRETRTRLTFSGNNRRPVWSPDGKWVAFSSDRNGRPAVYRKPSDGSGEAELLLDAADKDYRPSAWSPDGRYLAVETGLRPLWSDIWILSLEDGRSAEFLCTKHSESMAAFSPDGRWIAFRSDESGQDEIYVRPFPVSGAKWQVSLNGGSEPYWSQDGSRIFFRNGDSIWITDVESDGGFRAGPPKVFVGNVQELYRRTDGALYSVDRNGQRFLILRAEAEGEVGTNRVVVVVNWFEELKRLVPTG